MQNIIKNKVTPHDKLGNIATLNRAANSSCTSQGNGASLSRLCPSWSTAGRLVLVLAVPVTSVPLKIKLLTID